MFTTVYVTYKIKGAANEINEIEAAIKKSNGTLYNLSEVIGCTKSFLNHPLGGIIKDHYLDDKGCLIIHCITGFDWRNWFVKLLRRKFQNCSVNWECLDPSYREYITDSLEAFCDKYIVVSKMSKFGFCHRYATFEEALSELNQLLDSYGIKHPSFMKSEEITKFLNAHIDKICANGNEDHFIDFIEVKEYDKSVFKEYWDFIRGRCKIWDFVEEQIAEEPTARHIERSKELLPDYWED